MEELNALKHNGNWEIVELPKNKKSVGCKCVFSIKCNAHQSIERYKAGLVVKGFTQGYEINH